MCWSGLDPAGPAHPNHLEMTLSYNEDRVVRALERIATAVEAIDAKLTTAAEERARLLAKAAEIRAQRAADAPEAPPAGEPVHPAGNCGSATHSGAFGLKVCMLPAGHFGDHTSSSGYRWMR